MMKSQFLKTMVMLLFLSLLFNMHALAVPVPISPITPTPTPAPAPITVGSTTAVSVQTFTTFPATSGNQIVGFAFMENGFALANSSAICTYDAVFGVDTAIYLNGGALILSCDMPVDAMTTFTSLGSIVGNGYSCYFSRSLQQIGQLNGSQGSFGNLNITFDSDVLVDAALTFSGACTINGRGNRLTLSNYGSITVAAGSTLNLQNIEVKNVSGTNVTCASNSAHIMLQNTNLESSGNVLFPYGSLTFYKKNKFAGPFVFAYESTQTSSIASRSSLIFDINSTFSYYPTNHAQNLIQFMDNTSHLVLKNASLVVTGSGINLTRGTLFVKGNCTVGSDMMVTSTTSGAARSTSVGIICGDTTAADDFYCVITNGSRLSITSGGVLYKNVQSGAFIMQNNFSALSFLPGTHLNLFMPFDAGAGQIFFGNGCQLIDSQG